MNIIKYRSLWYLISVVLIGASIVFVAVFGLKEGIDFAGGSLLVVRYGGQRPTPVVVENDVASLNLGGIVIQPVGETDMSFRLKDMDEETHQKFLQQLKDKYGSITELRFDSIGPVIGQELRSKSIFALVIVFLAIMIYIAYAFRKVAVPIASWKYGFITALTAFHDVIVPIGLFALLGKLHGLEVGTSFVAAILTVMGFSIHDTIVVLDRVRENLQRTSGVFETIVNTSLNQTIVRSINTTVATLLALVAVYLFGGASVRDFSLALIVGIAVGAYSSIFIAAPLLVTWYKIDSKRKAIKSGR
ncbi:MAG: protein translocase subunit SecF [Patescibacteria group bacterium]|nr:protein translocase subunit SecF [Patescibacteria group bacterium]